MSKAGWMLVGALSLLAIEVVAAAAVIGQARGFSALEPPGALERWIASRVRGMSMPAGAKSVANPVPGAPQVLEEARAHWADHCALCHANDGSGDTAMGKGMYPPAPDMRKTGTQALSDGELFYTIQNGIRHTGMPGWGGASGHDEEDSWKLVDFIRHLPDVTIEERKQMEKLNPKSPDELREETEEEKFLKGESKDESSPQHHHH